MKYDDGTGKAVKATVWVSNCTNGLAIATGGNCIPVTHLEMSDTELLTLAREIFKHLDIQAGK